MKPLSASSLSRRYTLLVAACAAPLLLLIGILGALQLAAQRKAELEALTAAVSEAKVIVEHVVRDARDQLTQLKFKAENLLAAAKPQDGENLRALLGPSLPPGANIASDGLSLDAAQQKRRDSGLGNALVAQDRLAGATPGELEMALSLFAPTQLTHLVKPNLQWSYYFSASGSFITMYPFVPRAVLVDGFGHPSIGAMIDSYLTYEVYLSVAPAQNPEMSARWTAPYFDAAGTGWMVSHSAPVVVGDKFVGIVGTDLLLSSLDAMLVRVPLKVGRLWIVNAAGELIADRAGMPAAATEPRHLNAVLPPELGDPNVLLKGIVEPGRREIAGHHVITAFIEGTPWRLLFVLSEDELTSTVSGRIFPYGVILLGLLATILAAHYVLRSQFVRPAISLTEHLQAESADVATRPAVPTFWRPWFERITAIFDEKRQAMRSLAGSEQRYRELVEAMTDLVIRFTPDGRFTFVNEAFCRHTRKSREELLNADWYAFELLPPEERERQERYFNTLTPENPIGIIELRSTRPDGSTVYREWVDHAMFDDSGRLIEIQAVGRDVTEKRLALNALADSEQRYRSVVEAQTEFVVRMTPDGHLTFVNDAYCRYHGRSRDELLSPKWCDYDVLSESEKARFLEHLTRLTPEAPVASIELRNELPGFPTRWSAWVDRGIFDEQGRLIELQSVGRDVTDRVIAEQARQETERLRQTALEAALDGYIAVDQKGLIIELNPAAEAIFGRRREQVIGKPMADLIVPLELRRKHVEAFGNHLATGEAKILGRRIEVPALHADGSTFPIELVIVRGTAAEKPIFIAYLRDLTELKRAAAALSEREAQFRTVAEGVPLSIVISAIDEPEIFFVNERTKQAFGLQVGQKGDQVLAVWKNPGDRIALARQLRADGVVEAFETAFIQSDGREMQALVSARHIDYQGKPAVLAAITDITRQREVEAEMVIQREALHQSEKLTALGSLLAGVAHELNNPLSVVVGYSSMLKELSQDPAITSRAERIHSAAERCSRIVRTFLAMARKRPPSRSAVDVNSVVEAALELAGYGLRSAGIQVTTELASGLPTVWADEDQLHQVVTNLVINAQQALITIDQPRRLKISTSSSGRTVQIVVADNGPGIPEEIRVRMFEPFFTTKAAGVGTGVGLSVCRSIVQAHEGEIGVETGLGAGTSIFVRIPAAGTQHATAAADQPGEMPAFSANVLVIDDEPDIAAMVAELLRQDGHVAEIAKDAQSALKIIGRADVDIIVSDLRMPGLDGPGLYRAIRESRPDLLDRLLFITGDVLAGDIDRFLAETGAAVVEKPLDRVAFRRAVASRLAEANGRMR